MLDFIRMFYRYVVGVFDAVNVPLFDGIGLMDIVLGVIVISLVISMFWKGARV